MKKIAFLVTALLASSGVFAAAVYSNTTICNGAGVATAVTSAIAGQFVVTAFTPKCSSTVILSGNDNGLSFTVASGSVKGKNTFKGSSLGGGVVPHLNCVSTTVAGCVTADITAAQTAADALS